MTKNVVLVLCFALACLCFGYVLGARHRGPARTYNVLLSTDQSKSSYKGQEIKVNGLCAEVWLNGRLDTIVCPGLIVTEDARTTGVEDASVVPVVN